MDMQKVSAATRLLRLAALKHLFHEVSKTSSLLQGFADPMISLSKPRQSEQPGCSSASCTFITVNRHVTKPAMHLLLSSLRSESLLWDQAASPSNVSILYINFFD